MGIVCLVLQLYLLVLLLHIVLSWFPVSREGGALAGIRNVLTAVTEPLLGPLRRVLPPVRLGGVALDLSPLVAIIGVQILLAFICR